MPTIPSVKDSDVARRRVLSEMARWVSTQQNETKILYTIPAQTAQKSMYLYIFMSSLVHTPIFVTMSHFANCANISIKFLFH